jgi:hypothetical protein
MGENRRVATSTQDQQDGRAAVPRSGAVATSARSAEPDAVCAAATELARSVAEQVADTGTVGDHLGVSGDGERLVTHRFACLSRGYRGWHWAVTLARAPRSRTATVCETVLVPGPEAILAPAWVPWSDRLEPGDLGPTDVLPYRPDDPNLEPGFGQADDDDGNDRLAVWELGLGRTRVLGPQGRGEAATRWYTGARGPTADEAVHAAAACSTCGYLIPLAGGLRQVFGVCANVWSASDGQVVSLDHGCGAHSETDTEPAEPPPLPEPILDEIGAAAIVVPREEPAAESGTGETPEPEAAADVTTTVGAEAAPEPEAEPDSEAVPEPEAVPDSEHAADVAMIAGAEAAPDSEAVPEPEVVSGSDGVAGPEPERPW